MKTMIAALALVSLVACNTEKKSVADDSGASMPAKSGCCESSKASCDTAAKTSCEASKSSCTAEKPQG